MKKLFAVVLAVVLCAASLTAMADTMGLGVVTSVKTASATAEGDGSVQVTNTLCAVVLDDEGKIVSAYFDVVDSPKVAVTADGAVADVAGEEVLTKVEKGDAYGMIVASSIGKEFYQQMDALAAWCVGKTVEEAVATFDTDADAKAGCTLYAGDFLAALTKAAANAK